MVTTMSLKELRPELPMAQQLELPSVLPLVMPQSQMQVVHSLAPRPREPLPATMQPARPGHPDR